METILSKNQIEEQLDSIADQIMADLPPGASLAVVGIRSRGETLGQRLHQKLVALIPGMHIEYGTLDITLYRDDLNQMGYQQPHVRATEINFNIDDRLIVLNTVLNKLVPVSEQDVWRNAGSLKTVPGYCSCC